MPGTDLSFEQCIKMLHDPAIHRALRRLYGNKTKSILYAATSSGWADGVYPDSFQDDMYEILRAEGQLYTRYYVRGSEAGIFHSDVRGFGGVYLAIAPQFDDQGPFSSLDAAEAAAYSVWPDGVTSGSPRRYRSAFSFEERVWGASKPLADAQSTFQVKRSAAEPCATPADVTMPTTPQLRLNVGAISRTGADSYYVHRTQFLASAYTLTEDQLFQRIFEQEKLPYANGSVEKLRAVGWNEVADMLYLAQLKHAKAEEQRQHQWQEESAANFDAFYANWKDSPDNKWTRPEEAQYFAARNYLWKLRGLGDVNNEDFDQRSFHLSARNIVNNWLRWKSERSQHEGSQ